MGDLLGEKKTNIVKSRHFCIICGSIQPSGGRLRLAVGDDLTLSPRPIYWKPLIRGSIMRCCPKVGVKLGF